MRISLAPFKGRVPRMSDRALPEQNATVAAGCDMRSGEIRPFNLAVDVASLGEGDWGTFTRWTGPDDAEHWLQFPPGVNVVQGPVADDVWQRIFWTGDSRFDGDPRMSYTGPIQSGEVMPAVSYRLGVPAPTDAIAVELKSAIVKDIVAIHMERPMRIETDGAHGLETGELVRFEVDAAEPVDDQNDLQQLLNDNDFQITVISDTEFTLDNTDGLTLTYSTFESGIVKQYFDPAYLTTRYYVFTYVTSLGEEGPPSTASTPVDVAPSQVANLSIPAMNPDIGQGRLIENIRIYRTATGSVASQFQFVGEIPITENAFVDDVPSQNLGESLPSAEWDPPAEGLRGLKVAAEGFGVGHFDNKVAFSEPYQLHAWPTSYQIALDYDVVAVEVVDNGVVAGTTGRPYIIQGIEPRSMTPRRLENNYACVSARSMVSMGYAAIFATTEGLVMVAGGQASLLTRNLVTEKEWAEFAPETIHAYAHQGRYVAFYDAGDRRGGFIIDPQEPDLGLVDLEFWAKAGFVDPRERFLYLLTEDNRILRWDDPDQPPEPYRWRSKTFVTQRPANLSAAKLAAFSYPATFRIFADRQLQFEAEVTGPDPFVLPAGYLAREWWFEVEGTAHLQDIHISDSYEELEP